jgi:hypothetical protein
MDIAIGSLRARNTPMLKVEGLYWILDQNLRPAIVAGYGTNDPEKMSSIHQIIKFHVRGVPRRRVPIFNVVSTIDDYAVKHTRVATPSVVLYDEKIPASTIKAARNYLEGQYIDYVLDVAEAFRGRGFEVPPVAQFEFIAEKAKKKAKVVKAKAIKSNKRMRFITEEDDEDGPVRCLTPIKKQVRSSPNAPTVSNLNAPTASWVRLVVHLTSPIRTLQMASLLWLILTPLSTQSKIVTDLALQSASKTLVATRRTTGPPHSLPRVTSSSPAERSNDETTKRRMVGTKKRWEDGEERHWEYDNF